MDQASPSPAPPSSANVRDNTEFHRFELEADGGLAFLTYVRGHKGLFLVHTEVPEEMRGHGVGSALVKGALDRARRDGHKIVAKCRFVVRYMRKHPEYNDMLAEPLPPE